MRRALSLTKLREQAGSSYPEFLGRFPHPWIVWEPGAWQPAGASRELMRTDPALKLADLARGGNAVALYLSPAPDSDQLTLGRSDTCDLCINDSTLSRLHLTFRQEGGVWRVADAGSSNGCTLDDQPLPADASQPLRDGARLRPGQVRLTFYLPEGMWARLTGPF